MSATSVAKYNQWRDLMRSWGFTVLEAAGCDTQSASTRAVDPGGMFIEHHDASSRLSGNWGSLATILAGRVDVPPRLANLQFARDGQVTIVCKNVANHGGLGGPLLGVPLNDVNVHSCGAEVANDGLGEPYSPGLVNAIIHGEAAWAIVNGKTAQYVQGHKEWAPGRKIDPIIDMNARRAAVAAVIANPPGSQKPAPQEEDPDMKVIQATKRGIALVGAGYYRPLTDAEDVESAVLLWGGPHVDNERRFDVWVSQAIGGQGVSSTTSALTTIAAKVTNVAPADVDEDALAAILAPKLTSVTKDEIADALREVLRTGTGA